MTRALALSSSTIRVPVSPGSVWASTVKSLSSSVRWWMPSCRPKVLNLALHADLALQLQHVGGVGVNGDETREAARFERDAEDAVLPELVLWESGRLPPRLGPEPAPDVHRGFVAGPSFAQLRQEALDVKGNGSGVRYPRPPLEVQELHLVQLVDGADALHQRRAGRWR